MCTTPTKHNASFRVEGTSTAVSLAYLADGTSSKTTSAANTKLTTNKKTKC
jgi:hypothetical protein